ncbi:MAG: hypothetical protein ABIT16_10080 [Croceibacterium sp.]
MPFRFERADPRIVANQNSVTNVLGSHQRPCQPGGAVTSFTKEKSPKQNGIAKQKVTNALRTGRVLSHDSRLPVSSFPRRQSHVITETIGKSTTARKMLLIIGMMIVSASGERTPASPIAGQ